MCDGPGGFAQEAAVDRSEEGSRPGASKDRQLEAGGVGEAVSEVQCSCAGAEERLRLRTLLYHALAGASAGHGGRRHSSPE